MVEVERVPKKPRWRLQETGRNHQRKRRLWGEAHRHPGGGGGSLERGKVPLGEENTHRKGYGRKTFILGKTTV